MKLQIKSKVVSIHDKIDVLDENENPVYRVHTKAVTIHDKTYIEDAAGNEVAYIHAKAVSIHHVYYVEMANGETFELKESLKHIRDFVDIEPLGWQLRGDSILEFNFQIYDAARCSPRPTASSSRSTASTTWRSTTRARPIRSWPSSSS